MKTIIFTSGPGTVANPLAWAWTLALILFEISVSAQELPAPNLDLEPGRAIRSLTVGGQGEIMAAPHQAMVRLGAEADASPSSQR